MGVGERVEEKRPPRGAYICNVLHTLLCAYVTNVRVAALALSDNGGNYCGSPNDAGVTSGGITH